MCGEGCVHVRKACDEGCVHVRKVCVVKGVCM